MNFSLDRIRTLSLKIALFPASLLLSACATTPPPAPSKISKTWSDIVEQGAQAKAPQEIQITHELWTTSGELPSLDRLEVALASTGVLADVSGSSEAALISVGPNRCQARWEKLSDVLKDKKNQRVSACGLQLDDQQKKELAEASHRMLLDCSGSGTGGLIDVHNVAVSVAKALEAPHLQEGEAGEQRGTSPTWISPQQMRCGVLSKLSQYVTSHHVRVERVELGENEWFAWTRGLSIFGLPELALGFIETSRLSQAEAKLIALADLAIRINGVVEGAEAQSGTATGIYVLSEKVFTHLSSRSSLPKGAEGSLMLVGARDLTDQKEAIQRVTRRFTLP